MKLYCCVRRLSYLTHRQSLYIIKIQIVDTGWVWHATVYCISKKELKGKSNVATSCASVVAFSTFLPANNNSCMKKVKGFLLRIIMLKPL